MAKKVKPAIDATPTVNHNECGFKIENVNPTLPPDNEHTNAGVIALAGAVSQMATGIIEAAKALQEVARHSQKAGVYIGNCKVTGTTTGFSFK